MPGLRRGGKKGVWGLGGIMNAGDLVWVDGELWKLNSQWPDGTWEANKEPNGQADMLRFELGVWRRVIKTKLGD